ncbi:Transcriptional regulator, AraC family [hydrothermal vent metagenome]|uniref:Transcriptional regulator, AraC family n=1 Tax=hydrothermal vent metagenome TaxID=652676 RepID=A0A3B1CNX5_9ZZZZ
MPSNAQWHATSDYAKELFVTPDHLNRIVKLLTGKTTKEFIQSRISVEAKRMFYLSNLSIKEIGYKLGFSEPANFSAFFKKCTGKSPSTFKKKQ